MITPYTPGFTSTHDRDRLAWAAPDLLAALRLCERALEERDAEAEEHAAKAARAAIAKATGEA